MRKHDTRTHTLKEGILAGKSERVVRCAKAVVARSIKTKNSNKKIKIKRQKRYKKTKTKNNNK